MAKRRLMGVYVPRDVWDWLMGCANEGFEVPASMRDSGGAYPTYWWRSELRRRISEARAGRSRISNNVTKEKR